MVAARLHRPRAIPRFRQGPHLPQKGRALLPADPDMRLHPGPQRQSRRAFAVRLSRVNRQGGIHVGLHQGCQIGQGRDRHHAGDLHSLIRASHPRRQMPARRMARHHHRPRDHGRRRPHHLGNLYSHRRDPSSGGERVRRQCTGPAPRKGASGQVRIILTPAGQPIAPVDKHHQPTRHAFGAKEIERLPRARSIGNVRCESLCHLVTKCRSLPLPARIKAVSVRDKGGIHVIAAEIGHRVAPVDCRISVQTLPRNWTFCAQAGIA